MLKFVLPLLVSLLGFAVHAADTDYETARKAKLAQSQDFVQVMDEATPDELAALFNLNDDQEDTLNISDLIDQSAYVGTVRIDVSIATQSLTIQSPSGSFSTAISSARAGYRTARGCYSRPRLEVMHYSHKYHNSPMPHSMFYKGGFAIHGTNEVNHLGRPASHGCVRVHPTAAAQLYAVVQSYGAANTVICVH